MIKLKDLLKESAFTIPGRGDFSREEVKQLLIKNRHNEGALDYIITTLKSNRPEDESFVTGLQKLVNNPKALQMVITYFTRRKHHSSSRYYGGLK